ncbi:MAG: TlpA disulfide reductase family protein [Halopseudomonas sp.]
MMALLSGCEMESASPAVGVELAAVTLPKLGGDPISFSQFRGKVLVLNFWATWCGPCREEMPALQALSERLNSDRYRVIGITVDQDLNLVREFVLKYDIDFLQLTDSSMAVASDLLGVEAFPQTLIVGPDGVVKLSIVGSQAWNEPAYFEPLLAVGEEME